MVEAHKKELEKQLWNIANALRGNMSADEFRDYILGFIFYKKGLIRAILLNRHPA